MTADYTGHQLSPGTQRHLWKEEHTATFLAHGWTKHEPGRGRVSGELIGYKTHGDTTTAFIGDSDNQTFMVVDFDKVEAGLERGDKVHRPPRTNTLAADERDKDKGLEL